MCIFQPCNLTECEMWYDKQEGYYFKQQWHEKTKSAMKNTATVTNHHYKMKPGESSCTSESQQILLYILHLMYLLLMQVHIQ